ncbi:phage tail domain-containing protein [Sporolactobacillus terrae]|uniref:phage tail domain-containing protein n=1 Tax=Sporolactobacillus terrae TaxID=269673 RepID=UPI000687D705|nr:phage tail domain-containing protein [Sporolactobacillus terrae]
MLYSDDFKDLTGINDTTILIGREGKQPVRLDEHEGLIFLSFDIDPPTPITPTSEAIPGMDGVRDKGSTTYGPRNMVARFLLKAEDKRDYADKLSELILRFDSKQPFQIIDEDRPLIMWEHVKLSDKMTFERLGPAIGRITIPMVSFYPYGKYIGTIPDSWKRSFNTQTFKVYNPGHVPIDPRVNSDMVIRYHGASDHLTISNSATGEMWSYLGTTAAGDTLSLEGVMSKKNEQSVFDSTNHALITLAPGENEFEISGTSGNFTIDFDFPIYYFQ